MMAPFGSSATPKAVTRVSPTTVEVELDNGTATELPLAGGVLTWRLDGANVRLDDPSLRMDGTVVPQAS